MHAEVAAARDMPAGIARDDYELEDSLRAADGRILLSGTQALVRLPLMQYRLDRQAGLDTAGFVSGYRGSPLGAYDQTLTKASGLLDAHSIRFLPAVNEELAAAAVLGSQRAGADPDRTVDGVFALWYGKGPGIDRAGDALRHGNAFGSSPRGGVLVVAGDDHGCVSSSMPHQSDFTLQSWRLPVLNPANLAELIEFGLYGWALSRYSGAWVALKAISETVESHGIVDLDAIPTRFAAPKNFVAPADGLHCRWNDPPSLALEARLAAKLDAARAFAAINSIDRMVAPSPLADIGIVTCGKAHLDTLEVFRRLGLSLAELALAGVRIYKVGLSFPIESGRMLEFAEGLCEVFVIEEKGPFVEQQIKTLLFNRPHGTRPVVIGKTDAAGAPLLPELGELRPSRIMPALAQWLARHKPALDRHARVADFAPAPLLSNAADAVSRTPYFCSGCPHNTSTTVPEGSRAQAGIGCHVMASWMDRNTTGQIQMGGEGADWVGHSLFTNTLHVFQNLGDGTYFHSGLLAIRQAVAAGTSITYKILYNDAVAMTGGQAVDGKLSVDAIARQVEAEGVRRIVIVSDDVDKYRGCEQAFPRGTTFHPRSELDSVQQQLRDIAGVSVLIYEQTCAAEKRRRRKRKALADPPRRVFINAAVCEGCGDCGRRSNCMSIVPLDTPFGRKRSVDQSSCNKDYACIEGFCPSLVTVEGGKPRRRAAGLDAQRLAALAGRLPAPPVVPWRGPYDLLITGIGGTGVVTLGAIIAMAAHLENKSASVLDFTGFAQKGGAVLSHVRLALQPGELNQARIDIRQADAILACDAVVGASREALQTAARGRTTIIANSHEYPTGEFVRDPDATLQVPALLEKMRAAASPERVSTFDAASCAECLLGDTAGASILLMGYAWQLGLIPLTLESLERAIELNGVAVDMNKSAFQLGRLAARDLQALRTLGYEAPHCIEESLDALISRHVAHLAEYQDTAYANRYLHLVRRVEAAERVLSGPDGPMPLTATVAEGYGKLLAYKDEYEVARLFTNGAFREALERQFEGDYKIRFHIAPPWAVKPGREGAAPRKTGVGRVLWPLLRLLAKGKALRGTAFDMFGRSPERRMERQLAADYAAMVESLLARLDSKTLLRAVEVAALAREIRGFGHVKLDAVRRVKRREAELLRELGLQAWPVPAATRAWS